MSWTKLGDEFADDADRLGLTDAAVRTHVDALMWSNRRLLDLRIPKRDLARFAFSPDAEAAAKDLEAAGWWLDEGETWLLAYHPEWQQTREQVEAQRADMRERQERSRRHRAGDHSMCIRGRYCPDGAVTRSVTRDVTRDNTRESQQPDPTRPVPKDKGRGGNGDVTTVADPEDDQDPPPPASESLQVARRAVGAQRCEHHPEVFLNKTGACPLRSCPTNNTESRPAPATAPDEPPY